MQHYSDLSPFQCRAARALLAWTNQQLASASHITKNALSLFETGNADLRINDKAAVRRVLEDAGIEFTDGDGVRFKNKGDNSNA